MYKTLEVLGPEHEFALVDEHLRQMPIVDRVIKDLRGRIVNFVNLNGYTFGKELQSHVAEIKANTPFHSPITFEEQMHQAVLDIAEYVEQKYDALLLGTGMYSLLQLDKAKIWSHHGRTLYQALNHLFDLHQHGWLNIQAFQLNLSYGNEEEGIHLHNALTNLLPYLPAISASSPLYEARNSGYVDTRLYFYQLNQKEVPSITGNVIPEYVTSFQEYRRLTIDQYTRALQKLNAPHFLLHREWLNSRGAIFRFDRKALEIRIMDEQECIKADVALSCFIRACLRGIVSQSDSYLPRNDLLADFHRVIKDGLKAKVHHPKGPSARDVCRYYLNIAWENASVEEKTYLPIVKKRIEEGNLSDLIHRAVQKQTKKTAVSEAIVRVYLNLAENLVENEVHREG